MTGARVSVVMPAYNAAATLQASVDSVLAQTHRDVELLIVDDCSRDATWEMAQVAAVHDPRVKAIRLAVNGGVAAARNAGLEAATGTHIAFLDSDDRWRHDKLARQLVHMAATATRVSYTCYRRCDPSDRTLSVVVPPREATHRDMLKGNPIGNLTGLYDRSLGEFRFRRMGHEDYVLWLEVVKAAGIARREPGTDPLADYLVRGGSVSADKRRAARWQWRIYRDVERLDAARAGWYFLHYAVNAVRKRR